MAPFKADFFKVWGEKERVEFINFCQNALEKFQDASLAFGSEPKDLNFVLYELCRYCIHGEVTTEAVVSALSEILSLHPELPSLIADILNILDTESQCSESGHTYRERYFSLLRFCNNKIVPEFVLKERLDFETLGDAGIMKLLRNTQTKFIKTKTRLFYKQQKYNLYREEIEGYAKLITELDPPLDQEPNIEHSLEVLQSLIGCFNLDPNRVLDVILESFECKPQFSNYFTQLLRSYFGASETISQVIGFKFGFYQNGDIKETPASLYRVAAFLLKAEVMQLSQLYSLLTPNDSKIVEEHKQEFDNAHLYVKQLNSLSTNAAGDANKEGAKTEIKSDVEDNQKLGLCAALIDVGDWEHARQLMGCFPDYYATSHLFIAKKLCQLIHVLIDDFFRKHSFTPQIRASTPLTLDSNVNIKKVEDFTELFNDVCEMVVALGPHLHIDPVLMAKIIRLSRFWMSTKSEVPEYGIAAISNIIDHSLLPSLSLLECNCCMAEELWSLLKLFPYQNRYSFYYNWKTSASTSHPLLIKVKADILKRLKYIMKRLSKENVKPSGRQIGKLSHSNPGYIFDYILSQIQNWDNLIAPVIDSLKYLTSLSYDVLAYCVIEALGNSEKDRMKHDGTSISVWLQSLANFGGAVFKKYPIDISGLLQHVANQLIAGKSLDLLILKEVVQKMAGIEATEEMTAEQLEAMTGGELLRSEGGYFNQLRNVKKSSQRLKESLLDQDLAIPLCLLMAQQRNCILYHENDNSHVKLVGKLYDQCQDTLVQYGSFLANNLNMEDYANRLPSVSALLTEYNIQTDVAFYLSRPSLNHILNSKFEELRKQDKNMKVLSSQQSVKKYIEIVESITSPIVQSVKSNQVHKKAWEDLNPQFYVTFWSLSMYDLVVPSSSYEREINKLKAVLQSEESKDAGKKKKDRERCDALITKLVEEEKLQQEHCARVMARLRCEKDDWFQSRAAKNETITQFLQLCLFPRCIFTSVDALYCAKFVLLIHCLKTPNFSTLLCYDRVFCDITMTVASCTENEANRYGLFLCSMLETVMRWHSDKAIFDKECANFPGFMTKFKVADKTGDSSVDHVDYENYRHVCHKWHFKITKSLLKCLDSGDYVQIRNSLLVLWKIAPHFPVIQSLGGALDRRMEKIKIEEKEKRPDIYVLATGYSGILKNKKSSLIPESEFHLKENTRHVAAAAAVKTEPAPKIDKRENENLIDASKDRKSNPDIRVEPNRVKSGSSERPSVSPSYSQNKRSTPRSENEQNGLENNNRVKIVRVKEEKSTSENTSPMRANSKNDIEKQVSLKEEKRREERQINNVPDREASDSGRDSHSHRRAVDTLDTEREHKRRRTDGASSRSPREPIERDLRSSDERNGNRDKVSVEKMHKEVEVSAEKTKPKEKKTSRKREYPDDSPSESRRRRQKADKDDEESGKRSVDNDREMKTRREEKSPVVYAVNTDRRVDREEKKHHRSSSASGVKKRS
ncbi:THO complex subunit 2-like [Argiope bruennichi]|uniref:THO complex subunit 2-like n=1 Tax=Argiope bruennichi TaxID=94029 RepID=UPI00249476C9|nr:THO complex subunit 2-like [Argiope bruennichi]XP_055951704.1 THO complex subunit 2-like [Argiope bruennichi]XP_055951705.1 THO complex subunit 2-like [Argiope bruennichi]XP_055951706.1 THO complex subunit 2-like [Argiope bruennichi]XP_055951708.1 THO complex subunit 2-like [Argiope bruennichi]XP_055951709.1 THO complex subunit 2-like [Argiope bruennichi]